MSERSDEAAVDERAVLTRQLEAIIAQAEAALLLLRGCLAPPETCEHPESHRRYLGTVMGDRRFLCMACSQTVIPPAEPALKEEE